jgi:chorismate synthase
MEEPGFGRALSHPGDRRESAKLMRFTYRTAGESHGRALVTVVEGVPAGLALVAERDIDPELARRQGGYGRGARM